MTSMIRMAVAYTSSPVLQLAALALAVASAGCGKVGCFELTEIEGACPLQDEALGYFAGPNCNSEVKSVDSEPERDGDYCCYDITKNDDAYYYYDQTCSRSVGGGPVPPSPAPPPPGTP